MLVFMLKFSLLFTGLLLAWMSELRVEDKRIHVKINLGQLRDTCSVPCDMLGEYFTKIFTESDDSNNQENLQELKCEQMGLGISNINCFVYKTIPNQPPESNQPPDSNQSLESPAIPVKEATKLEPSNKPEQGYQTVDHAFCRRPNRIKQLLKFVEEYSRDHGKVPTDPTREEVPTFQSNAREYEISLIAVPTPNRTELVDFLPVLVQLKAYADAVDPPSNKRINKFMYNSYFRYLKKISWLTSKLD